MFSRIFIERPRFAIVISVVMVIAGLISLYKLPVAEYPEIAPPTLHVSATYTGASADVIAQTVAMPLKTRSTGWMTFSISLPQVITPVIIPAKSPSKVVPIQILPW